VVRVLLLGVTLVLALGGWVVHLKFYDRVTSIFSALPDFNFLKQKNFLWFFALFFFLVFFFF
jgi:hypothetical protein